jgi:hypothetical protein
MLQGSYPAKMAAIRMIAGPGITTNRGREIKEEYREQDVDRHLHRPLRCQLAPLDAHLPGWTRSTLATETRTRRPCTHGWHEGEQIRQHHGESTAPVSAPDRGPAPPWRARYPPPGGVSGPGAQAPGGGPLSTQVATLAYLSSTLSNSA